MSDLISRQNAIDALWELRRNIQMMDNSQGADIVLHGVYLAEKKIQSLPSAEPNLQPNLQPTCNQLATDCISRKEAIDAIDGLPNCYNGFSDSYDKSYIIGVLEELPSAEPQVTVFCNIKDCSLNRNGICSAECIIVDEDCGRMVCLNYDAERRTDE